MADRKLPSGIREEGLGGTDDVGGPYGPIATHSIDLGLTGAGRVVADAEKAEGKVAESAVKGTTRVLGQRVREADETVAQAGRAQQARADSYQRDDREADEHGARRLAGIRRLASREIEVEDEKYRMREERAAKAAAAEADARFTTADGGDGGRGGRGHAAKAQTLFGKAFGAASDVNFALTAAGGFLSGVVSDKVIEWNQAMTEQRRAVGLNREEFRLYSHDINRIAIQEGQLSEDTIRVADVYNKLGREIGATREKSMRPMLATFAELRYGIGLTAEDSEKLLYDWVQLFGKDATGIKRAADQMDYVRKTTGLTTETMMALHGATVSLQGALVGSGKAGEEIYSTIARSVDAATKLGATVEQSMDARRRPWWQPQAIVGAAMAGVSPLEMAGIRRTQPAVASVIEPALFVEKSGLYAPGLPAAERMKRIALLEMRAATLGMDYDVEQAWAQREALGRTPYGTAAGAMDAARAGKFTMPTRGAAPATREALERTGLTGTPTRSAAEQLNLAADVGTKLAVSTQDEFIQSVGRGAEKVTEFSKRLGGTALQFGVAGGAVTALSFAAWGAVKSLQQFAGLGLLRGSGVGGGAATGGSGVPPVVPITGGRTTKTKWTTTNIMDYEGVKVPVGATAEDALAIHQAGFARGDPYNKQKVVPPRVAGGSVAEPATAYAKTPPVTEPAPSPQSPLVAATGTGVARGMRGAAAAARGARGYGLLNAGITFGAEVMAGESVTAAVGEAAGVGIGTVIGGAIAGLFTDGLGTSIGMYLGGMAGGYVANLVRTAGRPKGADAAAEAAMKKEAAATGLPASAETVRQTEIKRKLFPNLPTSAETGGVLPEPTPYAKQQAAGLVDLPFGHPHSPLHIPLATATESAVARRYTMPPPTPHRRMRHMWDEQGRLAPDFASWSPMGEWEPVAAAAASARDGGSVPATASKFDYREDPAEVARATAEARRLRGERLRGEAPTKPAADWHDLAHFAEERGFKIGQTSSPSGATTGGAHAGRGHREGRAVDVSTRGKSEAEVASLKADAKHAGYKVLDERRPTGRSEWTAPHLHLEAPAAKIAGGRVEAPATRAAAMPSGPTSVRVENQGELVSMLDSLPARIAAALSGAILSAYGGPPPDRNASKRSGLLAGGQGHGSSGVW